MRILGLKAAKTFSRWVRARMFGGAMILGYHRVANVPNDKYEACVMPEYFAEHMEMVSRYAHPTSLSKLVQHLRAGSIPPKSVAVTFDDGYADNLYEAKPILEKFQVPATVFVCTGYAGREFWWDELEQLVMSSRASLHMLCLEVKKSWFKWDQPNMGHDAGNPEDVALRRQFLHALYQFLLSFDLEDQNHAMNTIRSWSGLPSDKPSVPRALNHNELLRIVDDGLIELGVHTRTHLMLPRLSLERQKDEIIFGKQDLEELLGRQVAGFAYPHGMVTEDAKRIVREAGFSHACTSLHDVVRPESDIFELTRFWQKDVDGDKFMKGLRVWSPVIR